MKILAFLQNQWFNEPDRVQAMYDERPDHRNEYIKQFLFMGCLTGRRLERALGEHLCWKVITWEEVSPKIGGHASSVFPADLHHIESAIVKHGPQLILAFGRVASDALKQYEGDKGFEIIYGPHPAARGAGTMPRLMEIGMTVRGQL